ncbi:MAG TPA: helix-turn-helix transcriptional regulator, partial [Chloroflexota bacterium]|nr:helix-turn-helix transcriptional regulator [Chloroflexota bacterium]
MAGKTARTREETGSRSSARPKQERRESAENPNQPAAENGTGEGLFSWTFRDFLIPYILLALSMQRAHGYFIEQYLRGLGLVNVEMSTLYRTLRQLERDGLVYSTWEPGPEGPARRIYSLTDAGRWWLDAGAAALSGITLGSLTEPARTEKRSWDRTPESDDEATRIG